LDGSTPSTEAAFDVSVGVDKMASEHACQTAQSRTRLSNAIQEILVFHTLSIAISLCSPAVIVGSAPA
jgi:hypothetical protein